MDRLKQFWARFREKASADEMFHETEVQANRLGSIILFNSGILMAIIILLAAIGVFPLELSGIGWTMTYGIVECIILVVICRVKKNDAWWLKYVLVFGLAVVYARLDSMLTHKAAILMVIPVVYSSRYFSKRMTITTAVFSSVVFLLSGIWGATHGMINLNIVTMPKGTRFVATGGFLGDAVKNAGVTAKMLIKNTVLYDYIPKWMMFFVATVISTNIARRGRDMVRTQHEKDLASAKIEADLALASRIQADVLPNNFPAFPDRTDMDIYASMSPAKEVGGDFYDFFLIDEDHLGLVIADVSGKGVPAALFMMIARILVKNEAMSGKSPGKVLETVNEQICANNPEEMFVTVWLGVLDLNTGIVTAANAGHEHPVLKQADGLFEVFPDKHGLVVGAMEGMRYKEYTMEMMPGSKLFLYTDGLPEATNAGEELFGMDRVIAAINKLSDAEPKDILSGMEKAVNEFVKDAEQFDDLTMLCVEFKGK